jgi:DNA-binding Lrp family transcriptional regulator
MVSNLSNGQVNIDSIDQEIIEFLKKDSRTNRQEIANKLNISRQTVQKRIAELEKKRVIKFTCFVNDNILGKETVLVLISLDKTKRMWKITTDELWSRKDELNITEIFHVTGSYDVVLKMKVTDIKSLEKILENIARVKGVSKTQTMVCLSTKGEYKYM